MWLIILTAFKINFHVCRGLSIKTIGITNRYPLRIMLPSLAFDDGESGQFVFEHRYTIHDPDESGRGFGIWNRFKFLFNWLLLMYDRRMSCNNAKRSPSIENYFWPIYMDYGLYIKKLPSNPKMIKIQELMWRTCCNSNTFIFKKFQV